MVKHTQTIRQQKPTNCLSVFDHFVGLALKGLKNCLSTADNSLTTNALSFLLPSSPTQNNHYLGY